MLRKHYSYEWKVDLANLEDVGYTEEPVESWKRLRFRTLTGTEKAILEWTGIEIFPETEFDRDGMRGAQCAGVSMGIIAICMILYNLAMCWAVNRVKPADKAWISFAIITIFSGCAILGLDMGWAAGLSISLVTACFGYFFDCRVMAPRVAVVVVFVVFYFCFPIPNSFTMWTYFFVCFCGVNAYIGAVGLRERRQRTCNKISGYGPLDQEPVQIFDSSVIVMFIMLSITLLWEPNMASPKQVQFKPQPWSEQELAGGVISDEFVLVVCSYMVRSLAIIAGLGALVLLPGYLFKGSKWVLRQCVVHGTLLRIVLSVSGVYWAVRQAVGGYLAIQDEIALHVEGQTKRDLEGALVNYAIEIVFVVVVFVVQGLLDLLDGTRFQRFQEFVLGGGIALWWFAMFYRSLWYTSEYSYREYTIAGYTYMYHEVDNYLGETLIEAIIKFSVFQLMWLWDSHMGRFKPQFNDKRKFEMVCRHVVPWLISTITGQNIWVYMFAVLVRNSGEIAWAPYVGMLFGFGRLLVHMNWVVYVQELTVIGVLVQQNMDLIYLVSQAYAKSTDNACARDELNVLLDKRDGTTATNPEGFRLSTLNKIQNIFANEWSYVRIKRRLMWLNLKKEDRGMVYECMAEVNGCDDSYWNLFSDWLGGKTGTSDNTRHRAKLDLRSQSPGVPDVAITIDSLHTMGSPDDTVTVQEETPTDGNDPNQDQQSDAANADAAKPAEPAVDPNDLTNDGEPDNGKTKAKLTNSERRAARKRHRDQRGVKRKETSVPRPQGVMQHDNLIVRPHKQRELKVGEQLRLVCRCRSSKLKVTGMSVNGYCVESSEPYIAHDRASGTAWEASDGCIGAASTISLVDGRFGSVLMMIVMMGMCVCPSLFIPMTILAYGFNNNFVMDFGDTVFTNVKEGILAPVLTYPIVRARDGTRPGDASMVVGSVVGPSQDYEINQGGTVLPYKGNLEGAVETTCTQTKNLPQGVRALWGTFFAQGRKFCDLGGKRVDADKSDGETSDDNCGKGTDSETKKTDAVEVAGGHEAGDIVEGMTDDEKLAAALDKAEAEESSNPATKKHRAGTRTKKPFIPKGKTRASMYTKKVSKSKPDSEPEVVVHPAEIACESITANWKAYKEMEAKMSRKTNATPLYTGGHKPKTRKVLKIANTCSYARDFCCEDYEAHLFNNYDGHEYTLVSEVKDPMTIPDQSSMYGLTRFDVSQLIYSVVFGVCFTTKVNDKKRRDALHYVWFHLDRMYREDKRDNVHEFLRHVVTRWTKVGFGPTPDIDLAVVPGKICDHIRDTVADSDWWYLSCEYAEYIDCPNPYDTDESYLERDNYIQTSVKTFRPVRWFLWMLGAIFFLALFCDLINVVSQSSSRNVGVFIGSGYQTKFQDGWLLRIIPELVLRVLVFHCVFLVADLVTLRAQGFMGTTPAVVLFGENQPENRWSRGAIAILVSLTMCVLFVYMAFKWLFGLVVRFGSFLRGLFETHCRPVLEPYLGREDEPLAKEDGVDQTSRLSVDSSGSSLTQRGYRFPILVGLLMLILTLSQSAVFVQRIGCEEDTTGALLDWNRCARHVERNDELIDFFSKVWMVCAALSVCVIYPAIVMATLCICAGGFIVNYLYLHRELTILSKNPYEFVITGLQGKHSEGFFSVLTVRVLAEYLALFGFLAKGFWSLTHTLRTEINDVLYWLDTFSFGLVFLPLGDVFAWNIVNYFLGLFGINYCLPTSYKGKNNSIVAGLMTFGDVSKEEFEVLSSKAKIDVNYNAETKELNVEYLMCGVCNVVGHVAKGYNCDYKTTCSATLWLARKRHGCPDEFSDSGRLNDLTRAMEKAKLENAEKQRDEALQQVSLYKESNSIMKESVNMVNAATNAERQYFTHMKNSFELGDVGRQIFANGEVPKNVKDIAKAAAGYNGRPIKSDVEVCPKPEPISRAWVFLQMSYEWCTSALSYRTNFTQEIRVSHNSAQAFAFDDTRQLYNHLIVKGLYMFNKKLTCCTFHVLVFKNEMDGLPELPVELRRMAAVYANELGIQVGDVEDYLEEVNVYEDDVDENGPVEDYETDENRSMEWDSQYDGGASSASSAAPLPINRMPIPPLAPVAGATGGHRVGDERSETSSSGSSRGDNQQPALAAQGPPAVETVIDTGSQAALPVVPTPKSNSRSSSSASFANSKTAGSRRSIKKAKSAKSLTKAGGSDDNLGVNRVMGNTVSPDVKREISTFGDYNNWELHSACSESDVLYLLPSGKKPEQYRSLRDLPAGVDFKAFNALEAKKNAPTDGGAMSSEAEGANFDAIPKQNHADNSARDGVRPKVPTGRNTSTGALSGGESVASKKLVLYVPFTFYGRMDGEHEENRNKTLTSFLNKLNAAVKAKGYNLTVNDLQNYTKLGKDAHVLIPVDVNEDPKTTRDGYGVICEWARMDQTSPHSVVLFHKGRESVVFRSARNSECFRESAANCVVEVGHWDNKCHSNKTTETAARTVANRICGGVAGSRSSVGGSSVAKSSSGSVASAKNSTTGKRAPLKKKSVNVEYGVSVNEHGNAVGVTPVKITDLNAGDQGPACSLWIGDFSKIALKQEDVVVSAAGPHLPNGRGQALAVRQLLGENWDRACMDYIIKHKEIAYGSAVEAPSSPKCGLVINAVAPNRAVVKEQRKTASYDELHAECYRMLVKAYDDIFRLVDEYAQKRHLGKPVVYLPMIGTVLFGNKLVSSLYALMTVIRKYKNLKAEVRIVELSKNSVDVVNKLLTDPLERSTSDIRSEILPNGNFCMNGDAGVLQLMYRFITHVNFVAGIGENEEFVDKRLSQVVYEALKYYFVHGPREYEKNLLDHCYKDPETLKSRTPYIRGAYWAALESGYTIGDYGAPNNYENFMREAHANTDVDRTNAVYKRPVRLNQLLGRGVQTTRRRIKWQLAFVLVLCVSASVVMAGHDARSKTVKHEWLPENYNEGVLANIESGKHCGGVKYCTPEDENEHIEQLLIKLYCTVSSGEPMDVVKNCKVNDWVKERLIKNGHTFSLDWQCKDFNVISGDCKWRKLGLYKSFSDDCSEYRKAVVDQILEFVLSPHFSADEIPKGECPTDYDIGAIRGDKIDFRESFNLKRLFSPWGKSMWFPLVVVETLGENEVIDKIAAKGMCVPYEWSGLYTHDNDNKLVNKYGDMMLYDDEEWESVGCINGVTNNSVANIPLVKASDVPAVKGGTEAKTPVSACTSNPCLNGSCKDLNGGYECVCDAGYEGSVCDVNVDDCASNPCRRGACVDQISSYTCDCESGWTGKSCDVDINECESNPCVNGACIDDDDMYTCVCSPGWTGVLCNVNVDECASGPCKHGECVDQVNKYECRCDAGWSGTRCETDVNECASSPCMRGVCEHGVDVWSCTCPPGWTGETCNSEIDECASTPCANGVCRDAHDSYVCECDDGWTGLSCETGVSGTGSDGPEAVGDNGDEGTSNSESDPFGFTPALGFTPVTDTADVVGETDTGSNEGSNNNLNKKEEVTFSDLNDGNVKSTGEEPALSGDISVNETEWLYEYIATGRFEVDGIVTNVEMLENIENKGMKYDEVCAKGADVLDFNRCDATIAHFVTMMLNATSSIVGPVSRIDYAGTFTKFLYSSYFPNLMLDCWAGRDMGGFPSVPGGCAGLNDLYYKLEIATELNAECCRQGRLSCQMVEISEQIDMFGPQFLSRMTEYGLINKLDVEKAIWVTAAKSAYYYSLGGACLTADDLDSTCHEAAVNKIYRICDDVDYIVDTDPFVALADAGRKKPLAAPSTQEQCGLMLKQSQMPKSLSCLYTKLCVEHVDVVEPITVDDCAEIVGDGSSDDDDEDDSDDSGNTGSLVSDPDSTQTQASADGVGDGPAAQNDDEAEAPVSGGESGDEGGETPPDTNQGSTEQEEPVTPESEEQETLVEPEEPTKEEDSGTSQDSDDQEEQVAKCTWTEKCCQTQVKVPVKAGGSNYELYLGGGSAKSFTLKLNGEEYLSVSIPTDGVFRIDYSGVDVGRKSKDFFLDQYWTPTHVVNKVSYSMTENPRKYSHDINIEAVTKDQLMNLKGTEEEKRNTVVMALMMDMNLLEHFVYENGVLNFGSVDAMQRFFMNPEFALVLNYRLKANPSNLFEDCEGSGSALEALVKYTARSREGLAAVYSADGNGDVDTIMEKFLNWNEKWFGVPMVWGTSQGDQGNVSSVAEHVLFGDCSLQKGTVRGGHTVIGALVNQLLGFDVADQLVYNGGPTFNKPKLCGGSKPINSLSPSVSGMVGVSYLFQTYGRSNGRSKNFCANGHYWAFTGYSDRLTNGQIKQKTAYPTQFKDADGPKVCYGEPLTNVFNRF